MKKNIKAISTKILVVIIALVVVVAGVAGYILLSQPKPAAKGLKIALIMWGHHDLGSWDPMMASGVTELAVQGYNMTVSFMEDITLDKAEDVGRMAAKTNDIVWYTSSGYIDMVQVVAKEYPDVLFVIHQSAVVHLKEGTPFYEIFDTPDNIFYFDFLPGYMEPSYLQGAAMAMVSETGKLGVVITSKSPVGSIACNVLVQGAREINPDVEFVAVEIFAYSDPVKTKDTVNSMYEQGVDVVLNFLDDEAVEEQAKELGIYSAHIYRDYRPVFPDTIVSNAVMKPDVLMKQVVDAYLAGNYDTWAAERDYELSWNLESGSADCLFGSMLTSSQLTWLNDAKADIISGTLQLVADETWPFGG